MKTKTTKNILFILIFISCMINAGCQKNVMTSEELTQWTVENDEIIAVIGFPHTENSIGDAPPYADKLIKHILRLCDFTQSDSDTNSLQETFSLLYYKKGMTEKEFLKTDRLVVEIDDIQIRVQENSMNTIYQCQNSQNASQLMAFYINSFINNDNHMLNSFMNPKFLSGYDGTDSLSVEECTKYFEKLQALKWSFLSGEELDEALVYIGTAESSVILYSEIGTEEKYEISYHCFDKYCMVNLSGDIYVYNLA